MVIETKVTLSDGREVPAFYLEEKDRILLNSLEEKIHNTFSILSRKINVLRAVDFRFLRMDVDFLFDVLYFEILDAMNKKIMGYKFAYGTEKSFHKFELWMKLNIKSSHRVPGYDVFETAFNLLVDEDKIVNRGSGWFRFT